MRQKDEGHSLSKNGFSVPREGELLGQWRCGFLVTRARQAAVLILFCVVVAWLVVGCGDRTFDAKGLVFEYPDGFSMAPETTGTTLVLQSDNHPEHGAIVLHWTEVDHPDAKVVINAALRTFGADADHYESIQWELIESAEAAGQPANYIELVVEHSENSGAPRYFGRLLLFESPYEEAQYILGQIVDVEHRDSPDVSKAWERVSSTLQFERNNAQ